MLLNRASRCFNNFHSVSPCFAFEVAFNASHLSSFSMLVPHNKQELGCKVNDAFSFRAGQLTHVSKLFCRPLAWTSSHIFAIVSDRFRIIPKLANVNPLHIGEKQFVNLLGMTAWRHIGRYWSYTRLLQLLHAFTQSMSCSENTVPQTRHFQTEPTEATKVLTSALLCLCPWPCHCWSLTHSLNVCQLPNQKKKQLWWISIS